jgi:GDPmannose 4,6-dehydratase
MVVRAEPPLSRAIVTGARGQDGSYLVELLETHGYDVVAVDRGGPDLTDSDAVYRLVREAEPREIYNLASPSFVPRSWEDPTSVVRVGCLAVVNLLEAVRVVDPTIRIFQASSASVFGDPVESPQTEHSPYRPRSPYGAAKAFADFVVAGYREQYGLHASCGILFNHESPRRPADFLPAKVARAAAAVAAGAADELLLGDLEAQRDWGYAPDFVEAMRLMLQQDEPDDYVVATGELHSVRELVELAFARVGVDWREYVRVDEALGRRVDYPIVGDATKARERLGWAPTVSFEELVGLLVDAAATQTSS